MFNIILAQLIVFNKQSSTFNELFFIYKSKPFLFIFNFYLLCVIFFIKSDDHILIYVNFNGSIIYYYLFFLLIIGLIYFILLYEFIMGSVPRRVGPFYLV